MLWHGRMRLRPVGIRSVSCDLCPPPLVNANWPPPAGPLALVVSLLFLRHVCGVLGGPSCIGPFGACANRERLTLFAWASARYMVLAICPKYGLAIEHLSSLRPDPAWLRWPSRPLALILPAVALLAFPLISLLPLFPLRLLLIYPCNYFPGAV